MTYKIDDPKPCCGVKPSVCIELMDVRAYITVTCPICGKSTTSDAYILDPWDDTAWFSKKHINAIIEHWNRGNAQPGPRHMAEEYDAVLRKATEEEQNA